MCVKRGEELSESIKTNILKIHEKLNYRKTILDKVAEAGIHITQNILKKGTCTMRCMQEKG
jgi:hypothetical protein